MAEINSYILNYQPKDYATSSTVPCKVDCSFGINSSPLPSYVFGEMPRIEESVIKHYPHDMDVIQAIIQRFSAVADLTRENLCVGNGSFDLLCNINLLYGGVGRTILGHAPQFSAYMDNAYCIGSRYCCYSMKQEDGYQFRVEEFISNIHKLRPNLVCCENPNNPTGQTLTLADIELIAQAADQVNAAVLFDEAYGDYLPMNQSALALVPRYNHVFVTKTFSKGFGMAGVRIGYVAGPADAMKQLLKLVTPFNCNAVARRLAVSMLSGPDYIADLMKTTCAYNMHLYQALTETGVFHVAKSAPNTPISLVFVEDENIDLCDILADVGIAAISGLSFQGLGQNAVRMMMCDNLDLLIELLQEAAEKIKAHRRHRQ